MDPELNVVTVFQLDLDSLKLFAVLLANRVPVVAVDQDALAVVLPDG